VYTTYRLVSLRFLPCVPVPANNGIVTLARAYKIAWLKHVGTHSLAPAPQQPFACLLTQFACLWLLCSLLSYFYYAVASTKKSHEASTSNSTCALTFRASTEVS
jgi:hypothetical protein